MAKVAVSRLDFGYFVRPPEETSTVPPGLTELVDAPGLRYEELGGEAEIIPQAVLGPPRRRRRRPRRLLGRSGASGLPVNFRFVDGQVVFRTQATASPDAAGAIVSFEVDRIDEAMSEGWRACS